MRIISGKYRGHSLVSFKAPHIRPTTDRVKESMFNKIAFEIQGARVLDLFSGTGNLGIEALSRGAEFVQFVDSHAKSMQILRSNLKHLKVSEDHALTKMDVLSFLKNFSGKCFHFVFIDPPFTQKMGHTVMLALAQSKVLEVGGTAIIETSAHEPIEDEYSSYKLLDRKDFGDKSMSFFIKEE